jgi:integral membrane protein
MTALLKTAIGRLRLIGFLEGSSLLALIFIGMPFKYLFDIQIVTKILGPIHGLLFLLFVANTFIVGIQQHWKFFPTTWLVLLSSFIPFGTFYIDKKILSKIK